MKTFELTRHDGKTYRLCSVYVPTNHLYVGDVVVLPEDDVIETDLTVEDGVSMILSAGASVPGADRGALAVFSRPGLAGWRVDAARRH